MNSVFLVLMALAPGIAVTLYIYLKDEYEPEPIWLLLLSFLYGCIAFGITYVFDFAIYKIIHLEAQNLFHQGIRALILVGLVEECSKFIFVRGLLYPNKNFDEPFDGIVYAVMVGMGFATIENIIYVINGGGGTAIVRMFSAIPAHAVFAILMGFFLGKAKFDKKNERLNVWLGLIVATVYHGVYDYFLFISFVAGIWILAGVSLVIAILLSRISIRMHHDASPFKNNPKEQHRYPKEPQ
ncbi:MAG TPA: PrsW family glutamic-type intramembrane protease [Cyclobacteriaceae bacterium]|jgi:RsiW-degrading membrane proteinase PrsW (M82 family)